MENMVEKYFEEGCSCTQCVISAFEEKTHKTLSCESKRMANSLSGGFGIGGMCGAMITAIMILGTMYDEELIRRLRLELIVEISERQGDINCYKLRGSEKCISVIKDTVDVMESLINKTEQSKESV